MDWQFSRSKHNSFEGFNNAAMNHFSADRSGSLIREVVQNSLDARDASISSPVEMVLSLHRVQASSNEEITSLEPVFDQILSVSESGASKEFFKNGKDQIGKHEIAFLGIHDFGTTGLTGPLDGPAGPWFTLVRSTGVSEKQQPGALGSFGHGSKAPFSISRLRTIFYYSIIQGDHDIEKRFLGKTILQSTREKSGEINAATGYFGMSETQSAILDGDIPEWVIESRGSGALGTTVLVASPRIEESFFELARASLLANFYLAIDSGSLKVKVGDLAVIEKASLTQQLESALEWLDLPGNEHAEKLREKFRSIQSIRNPTTSGILKSGAFGDVAYFLRHSDEVTWKRVGICRANGMLITYKPPLLKQFPSSTTFDLILWVRDPQASENLVKMENPQHNELSFDQIENETDASQVKMAYKTFTSEVKSLLAEIAPAVSLEEVKLEEIDELFGNLLEGSLDSKISDVPRIREISSNYSDKIKVPNGKNAGPSSGVGGGGGRRKKTGGSIPTTEGNSVSTAGWTNLSPLHNFSFLIESSDAIGPKGLSLKVRFTPNESGKHNLALMSAGEGPERRLLEQAGPSGPLALGETIEVVGGEEAVLRVRLSSATKKIDFGIEALLVPEPKTGEK